MYISKWVGCNCGVTIKGGFGNAFITFVPLKILYPIFEAMPFLFFFFLMASFIFYHSLLLLKFLMINFSECGTHKSTLFGQV